MQGIIVVDKPAGFTSFDVIAKLRGILKTKKIGHSGTLDPMATGVLPVFVGQAAKAVDMQVCHDKEYEAVIRFGVATDTGDITGSVLQTSDKPVAEQEFINALKSFEGESEQLPPMYSAVKINGQPLYKLARKGETVERTARKIIIYSTSFIDNLGENEFKFLIKCSKGTYVRTMCEDLGKNLGVPATLSALRRTSSGVYGIKSSHTLDEIQAAKNNGCVEKLLLDVDTVFEHLPAIYVTERQKQCLLNGLAYSVTDTSGEYRLYLEHEFLGVGISNGEKMQVKKLFCERE